MAAILKKVNVLSLSTGAKWWLLPIIVMDLSEWGWIILCAFGHQYVRSKTRVTFRWVGRRVWMRYLHVTGGLVSRLWGRGGWWLRLVGLLGVLAVNPPLSHRHVWEPPTPHGHPSATGVIPVHSLTPHPYHGTPAENKMTLELFVILPMIADRA